MKTSELKKLIREEIRRVINENYESGVDDPMYFTDIQANLLKSWSTPEIIETDIHSYLIFTKHEKRPVSFEQAIKAVESGLAKAKANVPAAPFI